MRHCPACDSTNLNYERQIPDHEYAIGRLSNFVHCADCRTTFQSPMPRESELAGFYPPTYHALFNGGWLMDARRGMRLSRMNALMKGEHGAVLDYGCGNGSFLVLAAKRYPQNSYWGFEYSDHFEKTELADGKVTLIKGSLNDLMKVLPPCRFIIMNHVIEHLPDPALVVSSLYQRLAPGGIFDGQTPNTNSLEYRLFKDRWSGYHAPRHTVVFSKEGLEHCLRKLGFSQVSVRGAFNPAGFAVSLGSLFHGKSGGLVVRKGLKWHLLVLLACVLMPLDLISGRPGMINFSAVKA